MAERTLYVRKLMAGSIFHGRCPSCQKPSIHGFYDQVDKVVDREHKTCVVTLVCPYCKQPRRLRYMLTTSRTIGTRGLPWLPWAAWLYLWVPKRLGESLVRLANWLDMRVRV